MDKQSSATAEAIILSNYLEGKIDRLEQKLSKIPRRSEKRMAMRLHLRRLIKSWDKLHDIIQARVDVLTEDKTDINVN